MEEGQSSWYRAAFQIAFTCMKKLALLPGLARLAESLHIPESDICVQVFILYPTHKQTELVK